MKVKATEFDGCHSFELEAETLADAAFLVRMGMNSTPELRSLGADAYKDGTIFGYIVIGKSDLTQPSQRGSDMTLPEPPEAKI